MASWGARMPVAARRMVATTSRGQSTRPPPTLPSPRSRRHGQGESSSVVIRRRTDSGGDDLRVGSSATPFRQDEEAKSDSNEDFETADSNEDFETANALALDMLRLEDLKALDRLADADPLKADVKGKGRARPSVRVRYADNESQLATRIKNLAAQGPDGLAAAVALVKTSHSRVAKVAVWTQLMQEAAHGGRWKTVRSIYLEMKRRRIHPDPQFFTVMFNVLSDAPRSQYVTLESLKVSWQQWVKLRDTIARTPRHVRVTNAYIKCLSAHGYQEHATSIVNSLPADSIDSVTMVQLLSNRKDRPKSEGSSEAQPDSDPSGPVLVGPLTTEDDHILQAIDKALAREAKRDTKAISKLSSLVFSKNGDVDQELVLDLLKKHFGIDARGKVRRPLTEEIRFDSATLVSLLRLLLKLNKRLAAAKVFDQVSSEPDKYLESDALDFIHCGLGIVGHGERGKPEEVEGILAMMLESDNPKLQPRLDTLEQTMSAFYSSTAPYSALRAVAALAFRFDTLRKEDHEERLIQVARQRQHLTPIPMTTRAACTLMQTAIDGRDRHMLLRTLRTLDAMDFRQPLSLKAAEAILLADREREPAVPQKPFEPRVEQNWAERFRLVLADSLSRLLDGRPTIEGMKLNEESTELLTAWRKENDLWLADHPEAKTAVDQWKSARLDKHERQAKKTKLRTERETGKKVDGELRKALGTKTSSSGLTLHERKVPRQRKAPSA